MLHERVDSAKRDRVSDELAGLGEACGSIVSTRQLDGDHGTGAGGLRADETERVLSGKTRVEDVADGGVSD